MVSSLQRVTVLGRLVSNLLARQDVDSFDRVQHKLMATIRQVLADARLDVRDFEMADSRVQMVENGSAALKRLEETRKHILQASEHGMFSPIEIAEITTELETIERDIKESVQ